MNKSSLHFYFLPDINIKTTWWKLFEGWLEVNMFAEEVWTPNQWPSIEPIAAVESELETSWGHREELLLTSSRRSYLRRRDFHIRRSREKLQANLKTSRRKTS